MSVLYKALQKAEKENEARQSASSEAGFDPKRLGASGASRFAGGHARAANRAVMAIIILLAVGGGAAFLLFKDSLMPAPARQIAAAPPVAQPAQPVLEPPAETPAPVAAAQPESASSADAPEAGAPPAAAPPASMPPAPAEATTTKPAEAQVAAAPVAVTPEPAKSSAVKPSAPARNEPMPELAANAPARMLSPPISMRRTEFDLAGVGDQVRVREVSQSARSNVSAGYEALIRGSYDMALDFYDSALKDEPSSVLALLGRGAALQKLGRRQEAQEAYEQVLKFDPQNREALTNMTSIVGDRAPQEALARLLELEREYQLFSPIKAQIGLTYAKMGSLPQALDYLRRAVTLSPDAVMYHYNLALVLDHLGRRDQAVAGYERVLASISAGRGPFELSATEIERRVRFLRAR